MYTRLRPARRAEDGVSAIGVPLLLPCCPSMVCEGDADDDEEEEEEEEVVEVVEKEEEDEGGGGGGGGMRGPFSSANSCTPGREGVRMTEIGFNEEAVVAAPD